jgi:acyl-CoA ligase (AMP-forming) (exosortase A-associated)
MDFLIHHFLRNNVRRYGAKEALVYGDRRLTYSDVEKQVEGLAYGLRQIGLNRGERVGVYLDASIEQVCSFFGISKGGGVFVPINHLLVNDQVVHIVKDCRMKGLITTRKRLRELSAALKEVECLKFLIVVGEGEKIEIPTKVFEYDDLCQVKSPPYSEDLGIEKDLACILYTSGSTGKPKGVMISHAQLLAGTSIVSSYLEITEKERILAVLPFSFDAGLNQLMTAFQQGGTLVLLRFIFAREIVQMLMKERITGLAGVPTLWSLLAQKNSSLAGKNPPLRYITNTGGAMPQKVLATLQALLPSTKVFLMYGLTEAFRSTYLPPEELNQRPTSMGKAIPNTEILVVNEQGQPCKAGEIGELVHRGPTVSMGYWGRPDLTEQVLRPHPFLSLESGMDEKVCYSGDLVKKDEDGFLYFVGRRDTMIKSSGFRISRTEVEEALYESGEVREAAVIGIPDDVLGQSIKAFVVFKEEHIMDSNSLLSFCAEKLPRYMMPKMIQVLEDLPKTSSGKVDYSTLQSGEGK